MLNFFCFRMNDLSIIVEHATQSEPRKDVLVESSNNSSNDSGVVSNVSSEKVKSPNSRGKVTILADPPLPVIPFAALNSDNKESTFVNAKGGNVGCDISIIPGGKCDTVNSEDGELHHQGSSHTPTWRYYEHYIQFRGFFRL